MKHLNQGLCSAAYGDKVDGVNGGIGGLAAVLSTEQDAGLLQTQTDAMSHDCNRA